MTKQKKVLLKSLLMEYCNEKLLKQKADKLATIYVNGDKWYLRMIDSTHVAMSNKDKDAPYNKGSAIYHVGQLRGEQYYDDLIKWLHNKKNIDGNKYH